MTDVLTLMEKMFFCANKGEDWHYANAVLSKLGYDWEELQYS